MRSPRTEFSRYRRAVRWLLPAALLALTPKCVMCVVAYVGLGAALGLGGPELCGASANATASWMTSLAWLGVAGAFGAMGCFASCRHGLNHGGTEDTEFAPNKPDDTEVVPPFGT